MRKRHKVAREAQEMVEQGGDEYEIIKNLLCTDIKSVAAWIEHT